MHWTCRHSTVSLDRPQIMGILNVTPDSFSDGEDFFDVDRAVDAALQMHAAGATMIDIGGESTRPGADRIDAAEQCRRVLPVIEKLRATSDVLISIDTTRSEVAGAAIEAGADIINDVAAGSEDQGILDLAAKSGCGLVLMHRRVQPQDDSYSHDYTVDPCYDNLVHDVRQFLVNRCDEARHRGVKSSQLVIDPGLGFGKSVEQNYALIAEMAVLVATGYPVLCAASRKSFIGAVTGQQSPRDRAAGSAAVAVMCWHAGVRLFRVHDIEIHHQALAVAARVTG